MPSSLPPDSPYHGQPHHRVGGGPHTARIYPQGRDPRSRKVLSRRWKWTVLGLAVLITLVCVPAGSWRLLRQTSEKYAAYRLQLRKNNPAVARQIAADIQALVMGDLATPAKEAALMTASTSTSKNKQEDSSLMAGVRVQNLGKDAQGRDLRRVELGSEQINAWLETDFAHWLTYRDFVMPSQVRQPMVDVHNGTATLFFTVDTESFSQVFQANFNIIFDEHGMATLVLADMQAGQMPVPITAIGQIITQFSGQVASAQEASTWINKIQNFHFKPVLKLPDGLKAQITNYQVANDKVIITLGIERYRPSFRQARQVAAAAPATGAIATIGQDH